MTGSKKAEKMVCNEMPYAENHHLLVNSNTSMLMGFSGNGSFTPSMGSSDEARMHMHHHLGSEFMNKANEKMLNEFIEMGLAKNFHGMHIGEERKSYGDQEGYGYGFNGHFVGGNGGFSNGNVYDHGRFGSSENGFPMGHFLDNKCSNGMYGEIKDHSSYKDFMEYYMGLRGQQMSGYGGEGFEMQRPCMMMNRPVVDGGFHSNEQFGMNGNGDIGVWNPLYPPQVINGVDQSIFPMGNKGNDEAFGYENMIILQGLGVKSVVEKKKSRSKDSKSREKYAKLHNESPFEGIRGSFASPMDTMYGSLADMQHNIYLIAKEQLGCRLLQRILDEGTYQDMLIIFKGMINHVSELMMEPFGNYLIQKLLDVCNEGQRTQVVIMVTKNPGELIKFSKNIYGTRVVQKIIETVNTRQQISLVTRALEPGFLDLVKDLNGNHVLQRCLQCFTENHNKFIFDGAARFCVDVATDRHGCCVLNHCIAHSSGRLQEKLVAEICANGLFLAQDPFGNYVVQHIIEREIPSAAIALLAEFEGHFVHLSMQKFSSHVVEQCLKFFEESRPRIIHELLSVPHFERLLQDPFANYVIRSALQVTKGHFRVLLARAVRPYNILRTSPYCKRIFSKNLLKK